MLVEPAFVAEADHLIDKNGLLLLIEAREQRLRRVGDVALINGAIVEELEQTGKWALDDGARMALACWKRFGSDVEGALRQSEGGAHLLALGYDNDIRAAARVDRFALVPEVLRDPCRIEIARRE